MSISKIVLLLSFLFGVGVAHSSDMKEKVLLLQAINLTYQIKDLRSYQNKNLLEATKKTGELKQRLEELNLKTSNKKYEECLDLLNKYLEKMNQNDQKRLKR